ncbi:hypothetical protein GGQ84_001510 [Desulfitispora alkaliphila]|uniref:IPT/TIG domain-containing protein n=1 Tax=Desulfitispora alkaliphila TaxID=622674 RepID=UPI003D222F15
MKRIKRTIALLLTILFIPGMLPLDLLKEAEAGENTKVTIRSTFEDFNPEPVNRRITIDDSEMIGMNNRSLTLETTQGGLENATNLESFYQAVQADIHKRATFRLAELTGSVLEDGLQQTKRIRYGNLNDVTIPSINEVETPIVGMDAEEQIIINGSSDLGILEGGDYQILVGNIEAKASKVNESSTRVSLVPKDELEQFEPGINDITISRTKDDATKIATDDTTKKYTLENIYIYKDAVQIVGYIDLEGISMFPTMGNPGSDVEFRRSTLRNYDVYFIRDMNDPELFNQQNLATNFRLVNNSGGDDVVTVEVPDVSPGPYNIVFTNPNSLQQGIDRMYVLDTEYTVIRLVRTPSIESINPNTAPARTPTNLEINGSFFSSLNIEGLNMLKEVSGDDITLDDKNLILDYGQGTLSLGENNYEVNVTREFQVYIGRDLEITDFQFDGEDHNATNVFTVMTDTFTLDQLQQENVIIRMITEIDGGEEFTNTIVTEAILEDGFTYLPATERPNISEVRPETVPIEEFESGFHIKSSIDSLLLAISGENFLVTRYTDKDGEEVVVYPIIELGGVVINPNKEHVDLDNGEINENEHTPKSFQVINDGMIVDGTEGNEIGNKILVELKGGAEGMTIKNRSSRTVSIRNPLRDSGIHSARYSFQGMINFQIIDKNDFPIIESVRPNLVAVEGGEEIVINGLNLRPGAQVLIDGEPVPNPQYSGDNETITFVAPPGRPGTTKLQVVNPEPNPGVATYDFTYLITYTEPVINSINPTAGTKETLVTMRGEHFLRSDPTATVADLDNIGEYTLYRLMGSRVLLGGHDINQYNIDNEGNMSLTKFVQGAKSPKDQIFKFDENYGQIRLGDSYESTILHTQLADGENKFYIITRNPQGQYFIEDRLGERYLIDYDVSSGKFYATQGSNKYPITFKDSEDETRKGIIKFKDMILKAYTPYLIDEVEEGEETYDKITGNRVRYVDSQTLEFRVPDLEKSPWTGDGYYEVAVINPDTKTDRLPQAFRFYSTPLVIPKVDNIQPHRGPDVGGNMITITSPDDGNQRTGFEDSGDGKTQVFIGGQRVPSENITISPNRRELQLTVPPYFEDIRDKGTNQLTVPVVLLNPSGGSYDVSYSNPLEVDGELIWGYTYIVPTSNPYIEDISPSEGSANGGYIVEIFGRDFRNFIRYMEGDEEKEDYASTEREESSLNPEYEVLTDKLYPEIYFGNKRAELLEFGYSYLQVLVPDGSDTVDLYVINNDAGISNKVPFVYLQSEPEITSVIPGEVDRYGGDRVEILGKDFEQGKIKLLKPEMETIAENVEISIREEKDMTMVKVGDRTNENLPREHENSGVIRSSRATVNLSGGLRIHYNAENRGSLEATINYNGENYTHTYKGLYNNPLFFNTSDLTNSAGKQYPYEELIKFEVYDNRLIVDGGYAPAVQTTSSEQLIVTTPAYYTVGNVNLYVINPDGGRAQSSIEYMRPDSKPQIFNMTKEGRNPEYESHPDYDEDIRVLRLNYQGGNIVSIIGDDFRENARIHISNLDTIEPGDIDYMLPSRMTFEMPEVPREAVGRLHRVVVVNEDGGSASSDEATPTPIYVMFTVGETNPEVEGVTPNRGPARGGTEVTITGRDFRQDGLFVHFGEQTIPQESITYVDHRTLKVITPSNQPGNVPVRVENRDGVVSDPHGEYTYISNPTISAVVEPDNENIRIEVISVEGQDRIKLKGGGYMDGARVVFNPEIEPADDAEGQDVIYIGEDTYRLVEGNDGTDPSYIDRETFTVTTPVGRMDTGSLMIINPDGGASEIYEDIKYGLPELQAPIDVVAELIYDRYIKINWQHGGAEYYEIYVVVDDNKREYIGSTELTSFTYQNPEPNTRYRFIVTAVGDYGSSPPSGESNVVRTGRDVGPPDDDGDIGEYTDSSRVGNTAQVSIGWRDFGRDGMTIDLTRGDLAGSDKLIVTMPARIIDDSRSGNVEVIGKDFNISFNPQAFNVREMRDNSRRNDAGVRLTISPYNGSENGRSGMTPLSTVYSIEADAFVGRESRSISQTAGNMRIVMDYDGQLADMRRLTNVRLFRYDEASAQWTALGQQSSGQFSSSVIGVTNRLGKYGIMGSRR